MVSGVTQPWRRDSRIAVLLVLAACLAVVLGDCGPQAAVPASPTQETQSATPATSLASAQPIPSDDPAPTSTDSPSLPTTDPVSGLPFIDPADLPPEALDTLGLIDQDGPFPFDRDGITFQNREELLPDQRGGYYREFTVITPGLSHRGPRRIVAGEEGERYFTPDHYESFERIRLPGNDQ
jgi:ribonuclease T1